ncbi:MAG: AI-2E family transporter [Longimicrobiales bacterium]|jgi:predicted PurR-regulated permease PerM|nr:AI-2E family transporter [Longimicrobiales bacterium]
MSDPTIRVSDEPNGEGSVNEAQTESSETFAASIEKGFFLGLLVTLTLLLFSVLSGFFQPIFWAALMGVLFQPVQKWFEQKLMGRVSLSAVMTLLVILVTVLVPTLLIAGAVADQGLLLYQSLQEGDVAPGAILIRLEESLPPEFVAMLERAGIVPETIQERISQAALDASGFIAGLAVSVGQNVGRFAAMFFVMLYLLFFVLRDGDSMLERAMWALPLGDDRERDLFNKFAEVGRATIKGTLVVGAVQGLLGGIMFMILGIQGAVFWGVVMIFLSILPAVGATLVWLPAALFLVVGGAPVKGLILLIYGFFVIGLADNILRPLLVGRDTKMPDWLILVSTLGGLTTFGISGFVIGPIIAAMFLAIWTMFGEQQEEAMAVGPSAVRTEAHDVSGVDAKEATIEQPPL